MAIFVHIEGLQGINLDLITHWHYGEKLVSSRKGMDVLESGENRMVLSFAGGEPLTLTGLAADALHRHFCTHGHSLT